MYDCSDIISNIFKQTVTSFLLYYLDFLYHMSQNLERRSNGKDISCLAPTQDGTLPEPVYVTHPCDEATA